MPVLLLKSTSLKFQKNLITPRLSGVRPYPNLSYYHNMIWAGIVGGKPS